jgi:hypothetical protein
MASTINASTSAGLVSTADTSGVLQLQAANTTVLNAELGKALALQGATSTTGCGIAFPATQSASSDVNTLDDYEEGTFTPAIESAPAGVGRVTTVFAASYTKVGRSVSIVIYVQLTTLGTGGGGNIAINGLPFAAANFTGLTVGFCTDLNSTVSSISAYINNGSTGITMTGAATDSAAPLNTLNFATYAKLNTQFMICGTYFI